MYITTVFDIDSEEMLDLWWSDTLKEARDKEVDFIGKWSDHNVEVETEFNSPCASISDAVGCRY